MFEILEYTEEYKDEVNKLMYTILVEEYGFEVFSKEILKSENVEYLKENNKLWIAIVDGKIIGTSGILKIDDKNVLLKKVYVEETYRGKGIAQKLLDLCITYALEIGYEYMRLETYYRLERARGFYTKNGFKECEDGYAKPQGDEIHFQLSLKDLSTQVEVVA